MHPRDPYYSDTRQNEKVAIIMALPIMLVCSLCSKLKKYFILFKGSLLLFILLPILGS